MAYLLTGRQLPEDYNTADPHPCIFCGAPIFHINDGGTGMYVNARVDGEDQTFLYCAEKLCPQLRADEEYEHSVWRCGCQPDYIENVGDACPACDSPREKAPPAAGDTGNKIYAYPAEVISGRELGTRELHKLAQHADALFGEVRLVIRDKAAVVPAEVYDLHDAWFRD